MKHRIHSKSGADIHEGGLMSQKEKIISINNAVDSISDGQFIEDKGYVVEDGIYSSSNGTRYRKLTKEDKVYYVDDVLEKVTDEQS